MLEQFCFKTEESSSD